jgi:hypothetical protein
VKIRHSTDVVAGRRFLRHNVFMEWRIFATPTATEKVRTATYTLRQTEDDASDRLLTLSIALLAFCGDRDNGLVVGEN